MESKLNYFIDRTDERLKHIEEQLEQLIGFRWLLLGMATALGAVSGIVVQFLTK